MYTGEKSVTAARPMKCNSQENVMTIICYYVFVRYGVHSNNITIADILCGGQDKPCSQYNNDYYDYCWKRIVRQTMMRIVGEAGDANNKLAFVCIFIL